jgi:hypothetical protein
MRKNLTRTHRKKGVRTGTVMWLTLILWHDGGKPQAEQSSYFKRRFLLERRTESETRQSLSRCL